MQAVSTDDFLQQYELHVLQEFPKDGVPAQWAPGVSGPRYWGAEDECLSLAQPGEPRPEPRKHFSTAFSPDEKFLAVSLDQRIKVYDLRSREQMADVLGHESSIDSLHWLLLKESQSTYGPATAYLLFVQARQNYSGSCVMLHVDAQGRIPDVIVPLEIDRMVNNAMLNMSPGLAAHEDIDETASSALHTEVRHSLDRIDLERRQRHRFVFDGHFPSFGSTVFSGDGRRFICIAHGHPTRRNVQRPADELPQIVVWDIPTRSEVCRLKGHTNSIMWAGWALGGQSIVTAAFDSYFKIWDAETGECRHSIGPTAGRQNWAGAVSPDGEFVLLSGGGELGVFMVSSGIKVADIDRTHFLGARTEWYRGNSWSPNGDAIAIVNEQRVHLADPMTGLCRVILEYENDGSPWMSDFATFCTPQWADGGRKLIVQGSEKTVYVWDRERNWKWRFQRPRGTKVPHWRQEACYVQHENMIVSVAGDLTVRWWKL